MHVAAQSHIPSERQRLPSVDFLAQPLSLSLSLSRESANTPELHCENAAGMLSVDDGETGIVVPCGDAVHADGCGHLHAGVPGTRYDLIWKSTAWA